VWLKAIHLKFRRFVPVLAAGFVVALAGSAGAAPVALTSLLSPAQGTWRTQNGTEVTVAPCPTGTDFCGDLTYIVIPKKNADQCRATDRQAFAALMQDYSNPDKSLQSRPILGLQMLTMHPTNDPAAFTASVYNPEDGSTNNVNVWIVNNNTTLRIGGGCVGSICVVTQDWPRVPERGDGTPDFTCDGGQ
jgi:uncharacterized protein (DUF2147 family)